MHRLAALTLALAALVPGTAAVTVQAPDTRVRHLAPADVQPAFPIRGAFYYPWFPEAWAQEGQRTYTKFTPLLGRYETSNPKVLQRHVDDMRYGGLEAGISSWWGPGARTDQRFDDLLAAAAGTPFRWALYYEQESLRDPTVEQIRADLSYIKRRYASSPQYLRVGQQFVVFVYAGGVTDDCDMARRWTAANTVGAHLVLKVFRGFRDCVHQPQDWHQYAPANYTDAQLPHAFTVSPGFDKAGERRPRLERNLLTWQRSLRAMTRSRARFQLVTSYNEWGEGTSIEPAREWTSPSGRGLFLDALRRELVHRRKRDLIHGPAAVSVGSPLRRTAAAEP